MTGGPTLRPPEAADSGPISALLIASIRTLCVADHGNDPAKLAPWLANKTPEHVAGWIASGATRMILAERAGAVAGVGGWTVAAPGRGRIVLLYVAPDHAGAGVGAALLARMEAEMVAAGCGEAELEATVTARGFYRAHGWRDAPRCGEGPCLPMTRTLAAPFPGTA